MNRLRLFTAAIFVAALACSGACAKSESKSVDSGASAKTTALRPGASLETATFHIQAMTCGGCASTIRELLKTQHGVLETQTNVSARSLTVSYDPKQTSPTEVADLLRKADYDAEQLPASSALSLQ